MKEYNCTGSCCLVAGFPDPSREIVTREGPTLKATLDTYVYSGGSTRCILRLDTGEICWLACTRKDVPSRLH